MNYSYATAGEFLNMSLADTFGSNTTVINGVRGIVGDNVTKIAFIASVNDVLGIINYTDPTNLTFVSRVADSDGSGTLDQIRRSVYDSDRKVFYSLSFLDNATSLYDVSNPVSPTVGGYITDSAGADSLAGAWGSDFFTSGGTNYLITASALSDNIVVWNVTNISATPVYVANFISSANPCSVDNAREVYITDDNSLVFVASLTDFTISALNIAVNGSLTCAGNYSDNTPPYSVDNPQEFYYEESTKLMYAVPSVDKELTIINWTVPDNPVAVGNITLTLQGVSVSVTTIGSDKYAFVGSNGTGGITVINVTNPALPTYVSTWNTGATGCTIDYVYDSFIEDNYLYFAEFDCMHSVKLYDLITNSVPSFNESNFTLSVSHGVNISLQVNASDIDGDTLTFTINDTSFTINSTSGLINKSNSLSTVGVYNVSVNVSDGTNMTSMWIIFNITNTAPTSPSALSVNASLYVGDVLIASGSGSSDVDNDALTYYYEFFNVNDSSTVQAYSTTASYTVQASDENNIIRVRSKAYDTLAYSVEKEANTTVLLTPADLSFSISLPSSGCSNGFGCVTGGCSACTYCMFNFSSPDDSFQDCQGQIGGNTSFYRFTNTGSVPISLVGSLNASLSSPLSLSYGFNPLLGSNANFSQVGVLYNGSGQFYSFDGSGDELNSVFINLTSGYTFSYWVKYSGTGTQVQVWDGQSSGTNANTVFFTYTNGGTLNFRQGNGTSYQSRSGSLSQDVWHHVLGINDLTNVYLYIDGVHITNTTGYYPTYRDGGEFTIGADGGGSYDFNGSLDDVRVFNRSLSSAEVTQVFQNVSVSSGLVDSWDFGDLSSFNTSSTSLVTSLPVGAFKDVYLVGAVSDGVFGNFSYSLLVNSSES